MNGTVELAPARPGQLTRRQHATRAVLFGGAVAGFISSIPFVGSLNICFGLWIILGGSLSVWYLQKKVGVVPMGEAAAVGALAGLVVGMAFFLSMTCVYGGLSAFTLAGPSHSDERWGWQLFAVVLTGSCVTAVTVFPLLASLGGVLAAMLLQPAPVVSVGPDGVPLMSSPPFSEELAQTAASRKKRTRILGCGCLLLLVFSAVLCGLGVCRLTYLEFFVDLEDTAGTEEIASVPLEQGEIVRLDIPVGTRSWSRNAIWLVGQDALPRELEVQGRYACTEAPHAEPFMETLPAYSRGGGDHPEWRYLTFHYASSYLREPSHCRFELTTNVPVPGVRIVVTRLTKPGDGFD